MNVLLKLMKMKISVIVPVYNVEKYLGQCLDSIVEQSYHNLEIILVNDGSTDNSPGICDDYAAKDFRITVIHQPNSGVSVARNTGIEEATGEYITFVDSDDWIDVNMYSHMIRQVAARCDIDMVMCDTTLVTKTDEIRSSEFIDAGFYAKSKIVSNLYPVLLVTEDFGKIPVVSACSCLIRRSVLLDNQIRFVPSLRYGEDYLFMAHVMISINSYFYLKGSHFYNYRQYELSRSKKFQPEWWSNLLELNQKLHYLLADSDEYDFSRQLKLQLIHSALFVTSAISNNAKLSKSAKLQLLRRLFGEPELKIAFSNLDFDMQPIPLKVVLSLVKHKMAKSYLIYRNLISKINQ